jgi:protein-S-isoprenylcysteine O-methyltransferase Ste14
LLTVHRAKNVPDMPNKYGGPNIRIPPAFYVGGFLLGMWLESIVRIRIVQNDASERTLALVGWTVAILGLAFSLWGILTFQLAHTPMFPYGKATRVVQSGPYSFTRNPMYVGGAVSYIGIAIAMNMVWPIILLPLVLWGLFFFVIRQEERYLGELFGDEYADFRKRVRRWL